MSHDPKPRPITEVAHGAEQPDAAAPKLPPRCTERPPVGALVAVIQRDEDSTITAGTQGIVVGSDDRWPEVVQVSFRERSSPVPLFWSNLGVIKLPEASATDGPTVLERLEALKAGVCTLEIRADNLGDRADRLGCQVAELGKLVSALEREVPSSVALAEARKERDTAHESRRRLQERAEAHAAELRKDRDEAKQALAGAVEQLQAADAHFDTVTKALQKQLEEARADVAAVERFRDLYRQEFGIGYDGVPVMDRIQRVFGALAEVRDERDAAHQRREEEVAKVTKDLEWKLKHVAEQRDECRKQRENAKREETEHPDGGGLG